MNGAQSGLAAIGAAAGVLVAAAIATRPARIIAAAGVGLAGTIEAARGGAPRARTVADLGPPMVTACRYCGRIFAYRGPGAVVCSGECGDSLGRVVLTAWRQLDGD